MELIFIISTVIFVLLGSKAYVTHVIFLSIVILQYPVWGLACLQYTISELIWIEWNFSFALY